MSCFHCTYKLHPTRVPTDGEPLKNRKELRTVRTMARVPGSIAHRKLLGALAAGLILCTSLGGGTAGAAATYKVRLYPSGPALEYLVKVNGVERCSGAMIAENQVITAAHCIIDRRTGKPGEGMSVEVGGREYKPDFAIYDQAFVDPFVKSKKGIIVKYDAAILTFNQKLEGKVVGVGRGMPRGGSLVAIGYQPTWPENGRLLRPKNYDDKSYLKPGVNVFIPKPAACSIPVSQVEVKTGSLAANCGLIPGGSGGPLLSVEKGGANLMGVLSTVNNDLTHNNWVRGGHIARIIGRADGVVVYSLNGPINGGPIIES